MTREEILAFLNGNEGSQADKFIMKLMLGFDLAFYLCIAMFGLLLKVMDFNAISLTINIIFVLQIIAFFVWYKLADSVFQMYLFLFVTFIVSTLKLVYAYIIFQIQDFLEFGTIIFGPFHIIVLALTLILAVHISLGIFKAFKSLGSKTETKISKATVVIASIAPSGISAPLLLNLFGDTIRERLEKLGLGLGFYIWVLACIWLLLAIMTIPKLVISLKYKHLYADE